MPAVGDQHNPQGAATANPFEEAKPRVSEYTAQEIEILQSRLDKQLGPEYISARPGAGGQKVHYLAADKAINLANEVFGFNGWSSSIQTIQIDFADENPQTGRISLGLSVIMRITLRDGTYHEDIGYGQIENCKGKAAAFEKAKKEGTTDALKRTLRNFGNVLGNCIYDKNYLAKVTRVKVGAPKWDPDNLHRHADFAPKRAEAPKAILPAPVEEDASFLADLDDSFDPADFDEMDFNSAETGHPDEVSLPAEPVEAKHDARHARPPGRAVVPPRPNMTTPSKPPSDMAAQRPTPARAVAANMSSVSSVVPQPLPGQRQLPAAAGARGPDAKLYGDDKRPSLSSSSGESSAHSNPQPPLVAGFYSARAACHIDANNNAVSAASAPKFDPHSESPSIRKTAGIDHNKSMPLKRDLSVDLTAVNKVKQQQQAEMNRPASGTHAGFQNRGPSTSAYRPPARRGLESPGAGHPVVPGGGTGMPQTGRRTPLEDVSNVQHSATAVTGDGNDAKRQKLRESGQQTGAPEGAAPASG